MYIDSHCHLQLIDYQILGLDCDAVVAAAQAAGVGGMLCVATRLDQQDQLFAICAKYQNVNMSIGLHPNEEVGANIEISSNKSNIPITSEFAKYHRINNANTEIDSAVIISQEPSVEDYVAIVNLAASKSIKLVAIGETGLDYYRIAGDSPLPDYASKNKDKDHSHAAQIDLQHTRFRNQIQAAKLTKKPLIVHTRSAKEDTLRILREEGADTVSGVIHCFTEDWEYAKRVIDLNFHVSFSGIVTFKQAQELQLVAKQLPLERMLIETDSPYLAPVPLRGKMNQPAYVVHVAKFIADLRNMSVEDLAEATTANYHRLFG